MCQRVNAKHECRHQAASARFFPAKAEDCPDAVALDRHNAGSGKLMQCETIPAKDYNIGGHCERPECRLWYFVVCRVALLRLWNPYGGGSRGDMLPLPAAVLPALHVGYLVEGAQFW